MSNNNGATAAASPFSGGFKAIQRDTIKDGRISPDVASALLLEWHTLLDHTNQEERERFLINLAVACSHGTSAETNFYDRVVDSDDPESANLGVFIEILSRCDQLSGKENKLRVWCRSHYVVSEAAVRADPSLPYSFADLTKTVIESNEWLRRERASDYEVDSDRAGVSFDYSEAITKSLPPGVRQMQKYGLLKKAGNGRSSIYALPGAVENVGTSPADRGVGQSVVPDTSRVSRATRGPGGVY